MEEIKHLVKLAGPKMVPFIKSVTIYFLLVENQEQIWATILKCAPIISLILFVLLYGIKLTRGDSYTYKIILGLIFSCAGDALLNFNRFTDGMAMFSVAQICYITAFGFKPLKLWIGVLLLASVIAYLTLIHHKLEDSIIVVALPIYAILLSTMCWRALARVDKFKGYNFTNITGALGSLLFVVSDLLLSYDRFMTPIPNRRMWVMTTYYAAQFGITLSVVTLKRSKSDKVILQKDSQSHTVNNAIDNNINNNNNINNTYENGNTIKYNQNVK